MKKKLIFAGLSTVFIVAGILFNFNQPAKASYFGSGAESDPIFMAWKTATPPVYSDVYWNGTASGPFNTTTARTSLGLGAVAFQSTELDPKVGTLTNGQWCTSNGSQVICNTNPPSGGITLASISATSPILYNNSTGVISEQVANTSQSGYLTNTDWNTFNGKYSASAGSLPATTFTGAITENGGITGSGAISVSNTITGTTLLSNLINCSNGVIANSGGQLVCNGSAFLTSEAKVGATTSGNWCVGNGTQVVCSTAAPVTSVGNWAALNYPTWSSGTPFVKMTAAGTFALDSNTYQPLATNLTSIGGLANTTGFLYNNGSGTFSYATAGSGTVTGVSVVTANGVSGSSSGGATPALTISLGAITPTSVNGVSAATMAYVDPTSSIQGQLNAKAALAGATFSGGIVENGGITGSGAINVSNTITGTALLSNLINCSNGVIANSGGQLVCNGSAFLTGNQTITLGGILSGSGTTVITASAASGYYMPTTADQISWNGKQAGGSYQPLATVLTNTTASYTTTIDTRLAGTSGTNTGDNAVNSNYSSLVSNATHTGDATGATALTVKGINGTILSGLGTGLIKNTTGTGVPSIAVNSDLPVMTATVGGAVPTPPNNTTTFLRGDGTWQAPPGGSGTVTGVSVVTANGVSGSSSGGATPALTISLGAITPTSVNGVSAATMAYVDPTSSIQGQLNAKAALAGATFSGGIVENGGITGSGAISVSNTVTGTALLSNLTNCSNGTITNSSGQIICNASPFSIHTGSGTSGDLTRWTGGTSLGNSVIQDNGTAVAIGRTPTSYALYVAGAGTIYADSSITAAGAVTGSNLSGTNTGDQNLSGYALLSGATFSGGIVENGGITGSGAINVSNTITGTTITGSSFIYSSDRNLKKNIETIQNPLEKILKLRGVTFDWKKDNSHSVGLIAQEVEQVFPELVATTTSGYKGISYGNLVAPLIEAVKAQQKEIEELKADQANLKAQILILKK